MAAVWELWVGEREERVSLKGPWDLAQEERTLGCREREWQGWTV